MGRGETLAPLNAERWDDGERMRKTAPKHAIGVLRKEGIRSLFFRILGRTLYRRLLLIEHALDKPVPEVTARVPVIIAVLKEDEVDEYVAFRNEADPSEIRLRLKAGQWCFVARHEGRIVHACWTAANTGWIEYLGLDIRLAQDELYSYDAFTSPRYRGMLISHARRAHMLRHFRDGGYRRVLSAIHPENRKAFRALEKSPYREVGRIGWVKIGPLRQDFWHVRHSV